MAEPSFNDTRMLPLYRRLLRYAARRRLALSGVAITMLLDIGMNLLKPWPMAIIVDSVLGTKALPAAASHIVTVLPGGHSAQDLLLWAVLATVLVFVLGWTLSLAAKMANISFGERMQYDLAADVLRHLQRQSLAYHSRRGAGDLMRRVTVDSGCVATIVRDGLLPVATSVVSLVLMFTVMLQLDPVLTLLALVVVPPLAMGVRRFSAPMAERDYEQQEAEGRLYGVVEESLSGAATVQAFGGEPREERRFRRITELIMRCTLASTAVQFRFKIWVGTATALGTAAVLYVGGRHALAGDLSVGEILVFLSYLSGLYGPLESLMYTSSTLQGAAGSAYRVMEVLDAAPEVVDGPGVLAGRAAGHVRLEEVVFSYEPGRPVLHGVSFEALPGELVALVGATGAGKSTIAGLVMRFFDPVSGRVWLDGTDIRELRLDGVRSQVGLVLQESFLFPMSIADNIAYGRPGASREEVVAAAVAANAEEFIVRLPEGYDTV
ncbi:MAG: ABC transporter ATP-binding protein/permease, partial [Actinomycetota bacterium]|nr:ABC transporter ATP-binding protein/permease [Actinomycetota bacterium]